MRGRANCATFIDACFEHRDSCNEDNLHRDEFSMPLQGCVNRGEQLHRVVHIAMWNKAIIQQKVIVAQQLITCKTLHIIIQADVSGKMVYYCLASVTLICAGRVHMDVKHTGL